MNDRWRTLSNAAAWIWLGGSLCLSFIVAPAIFSSELRPALSKEQAGLAAQAVLKRHFFFQCACSALMCVGMIAQTRTAKPCLHNTRKFLWALATILVLLGGLWLAPKLSALHQQMYPQLYGLPATTIPIEPLKSAFGKWHGMAQLANLAVMIGIGLWLILAGRDARSAATSINSSSADSESGARERA